MLQSMNDLVPVRNKRQIIEAIDLDRTYYLKIAGNNTPIAQRKGKDWVKSILGETALKQRKTHSWLDILNSGKLIANREYTILAIFDDSPDPIVVYRGVASSPDFVETLADNPEPVQVYTSDAYVRNNNKDMKYFSESVSTLSNQAMISLQDELQRKDEFLRAIQQDANSVYERMMQRESEFLREKEAMMNEKLDLKNQLEDVKRQLELLKQLTEHEKEAMKRQRELERKIEKLQNESTNKIDWNATLKDFAPFLSGILMQRFTGQPLPAMMNDFSAQNYQTEIDNVQENENDSTE